MLLTVSSSVVIIIRRREKETDGERGNVREKQI